MTINIVDCSKSLKPHSLITKTGPTWSSFYPYEQGSVYYYSSANENGSSLPEHLNAIRCC